MNNFLMFVSIVCTVYTVHPCSVYIKDKAQQAELQNFLDPVLAKPES